MASPLVNERDLEFVLFDILQVEKLAGLKRFADHSAETMRAAIRTAHDLALEKFHPHNAKADRNEPVFDGEKVVMIPEVAEALAAYRAAGLMAAHKDYELGGMQLPWTVAQACSALFQSANVSTAGYPFLAVGAANLLEAFGSQEQKELYMRPIFEGRFFGTMCLSEPQAGSSLADIRTRAEKQADGSYRLVGSKMWISAGEHDLTENIVHLVLAKIVGGPPGVKGISLFVVPKVLVNADGSLGARNDVRLVGLNHKMGYRGTTNTALNFGEKGGAVGYLVGQEHRGLEYMFHMMNEARIGVGSGAVMLAYAAYLYALGYARQRPQGRLPDAKDPTQKMVPIVEHADVKRMLLHQKWVSEGGLHLVLFASKLVDLQHEAESEAERRRCALLLDVLTPVVKGWMSEVCLKSNEYAIQVLGGYGYTREYPVEQYYRDQRLNPIHEGTDGIQAIDLLGRKVSMQGGAAFRLLMEEVRNTIAATAGDARLAEHAQALERALETIEATTATLLQAAGGGKVNLALANAAYYLDMVGLAVMGWIWLQQAQAALARTAADEEEKAFLAGKLHTCRYFFRYEVTRIAHLAPLLASLDDTTLEMQSALFG
ncbi:MAG: acyl-CoA dehydrogenase [Reyranellaceae bacterium]